MNLKERCVSLGWVIGKREMEIERGVGGRQKKASQVQEEK